MNDILKPTPEQQEIIKLKNLHKSFGVKTITKGLDLSVNPGEFLAIIGGSGEGKSVLFKQIIGLLDPDEGEIWIDGVDITKTTDKEHVFKICGYVFQFAALLDSLSVLENVAITISETGLDLNTISNIVSEKLRDVGLSPDVMQKYPSELSGGMKKRVGLARTLMRKPKILLYDEPTTGLDPITVTMIHKLIRETHDRTKATSLVISHDVDIFNYADNVAMLFDGKIIYKGSAKDIWECQNPFVYQFIRGKTEGPIQK